jgi:Domain of unknown function (DUF6473)
VYQGYQRIDGHFIDYELYELPRVRGSFRGPPVDGEDYVACLGGAQTFGRFVQKPFPKLLAETLGISALNLGRGGASPTFPLSDPALLDYVNRARLVIVQVFSGRSQSNSLFQIVGHGMVGVNLANRSEASADEFYSWLLGQDKELARKIIAETRENYVRSMTQLFDAIVKPKILLWFSVRKPDYQEELTSSLHRLWAEFPQLVNRPMMDQLQNRCDLYVECVSRRGMPQPIPPTEWAELRNLRNPLDFPSQEPKIVKTENRYYPSPEMHQDAAELLIPACRKLLDAARI